MSARVVAMVSWLMKHRKLAASPRAKVVLWMTIAIVFVGGAAASLRSLPEGTRFQHLEWLVPVALLGIPATVILNGYRFLISAQMLGSRPSLGACVRVSVVASAANLLPLPGAFLVRVQGLKQMGAGYGAATLSTSVLAAAWIGVTGVMAGGLQIAVGLWGLGGALAGVGLAALVAAWVVLRGRAPAGLAARLAWRIIVIEVAVSVVAAGRMYCSIRAMGADVTPSQSFALVVGGVVASAAGVFPGGIGLREAACAGLSPLVGLAPAVGFLAAAVDRLVGLAAMAPTALLLAVPARVRAAERQGS